MRRLTVSLLVLLASLALAGSAHAYTFSGFTEDVNYDGTATTSLAYDASTDDFRSPFKRMFCVLVHVKPGDIVDTRLWLQVINPNSSANQAWTVLDMTGQRVQSEHWSLWVMQSARVSAGPDCDSRWWNPSPAMESNFDNYSHYFDVTRAAYWKVPDDPYFGPVGAGATKSVYLSAWVYFVAGKGYALGTPTITFPPAGDYSRLQAAVFTNP